MSRNNNGRNGRDFLAGNLEHYLLEKALEKRNLAHRHIENVYETVPKKYHKHIRLLSHKEKIYDQEFSLTHNHRDKGLHSFNGKTYVETFRPYVDVEGRITEMIDVHAEHNASYSLDTYAEQIGPVWVMTCSFEGINKLGQTFKTKERAIIGFGGSGVDASNPIENASTSAIGRALSHGGYGNIGSGLTSFEDQYSIGAINKVKDESKISEGSSSTDSMDQTLQGSKGDPHGSGKSEQRHKPETSNPQSPVQTDRQNDSTSNSGKSPSDDNRRVNRERNEIMGRLMNHYNNFDMAYKTECVKQWLRIDWNGRYNSLTLEQLQIVEGNLKKLQQHHAS